MNHAQGDLAAWCFEQGGPIIRYRVAAELLDDLDGISIEDLERELLDCDEVRRWLNNLGAGPIHHSKDTAAENAMGKLLEYGLRAGMEAFDEKAAPYRSVFGGGVPSSWTSRHVLVPFLVRAGYHTDANVYHWFMDRLCALHRTAERGEFDVHLDAVEKGDVPKAWVGKPVYRPEFDPVAGEYPLPSCYDYYTMAYFPKEEENVRRMIEDVAAYVADPRFQSIEGGYIWNPERRTCNAAGKGFLAHLMPARRILFLEMAANFAASRAASWFREAIDELERCRTPEGRYLFPSEYLRERSNGYYLYAGAHMGLGENRRRRIALEIESTFRMLLIRKEVRHALHPSAYGCL